MKRRITVHLTEEQAHALLDRLPRCVCGARAEMVLDRKPICVSCAAHHKNGQVENPPWAVAGDLLSEACCDPQPRRPA